MRGFYPGLAHIAVICLLVHQDHRFYLNLQAEFSMYPSAMYKTKPCWVKEEKTWISLDTVWQQTILNY